MATETDSFAGGFPTTGSIREVLASLKVDAPHSSRPYTEAALMGLAGGAAFGYFIFQYSGHEPQVNLVTRNTFNDYGWDTVLRRLGIEQNIFRTARAETARTRLGEALESGQVPVVWADVFTLGYESSEFGDEMWSMQPVVVRSYDPGGEAVITDRAAVPFAVSSDSFDAARARVARDKFRMVTLGRPVATDIAGVVRDALKDAVALFYEKPPKGSANSFGLKALERWMSDVSKPSGKTGWMSRLPDGPAQFAGLTSAYKYGLQFWKDRSMTADRELFADFLDEVSGVVSADLEKASSSFRESGARWRELGRALLPDDVPLLAEARELLDSRHSTFLECGGVPDLQEIDAAITRTRIRSGAELNDREAALRVFAGIADALESLRDAEDLAFTALRDSVGEQ
jgi:hypothetical protein